MGLVNPIIHLSLNSVVIKIFISSPDRDIQFLQSQLVLSHPKVPSFRNVQSQSKGLNIPMRNIYSYSFENDPNDNRETGAVNIVFKEGKTYTLNFSLLNQIRFCQTLINCMFIICVI